MPKKTTTTPPVSTTPSSPAPAPAKKTTAKKPAAKKAAAAKKWVNDLPAHPTQGKIIAAEYETANGNLNAFDTLATELGHQTTEKVKGWAAQIAARTAALGCCFLCGGDAPLPSTVCSCVAKLVGRDVWHVRAANSPYGALMLARAVKAREIRDSVDLFTRKCNCRKGGDTCGKPFTYRVGSLKRAVERYLSERTDKTLETATTEDMGGFTYPRKCNDCRKELAARRAASGPILNAAPPSSRKLAEKIAAVAAAPAKKAVL
jgi:hypothetical protein